MPAPNDRVTRGRAAKSNIRANELAPGDMLKSGRRFYEVGAVRRYPDRVLAEMRTRLRVSILLRPDEPVVVQR